MIDIDFNFTYFIVKRKPLFENCPEKLLHSVASHWNGFYVLCFRYWFVCFKKDYIVEIRKLFPTLSTEPLALSK